MTNLQFSMKNEYMWHTFSWKTDKNQFKYSDAPKITESMHIAIDDLKLDHPYSIYHGTLQFAMQDKITACRLTALQELTL